MTTRNHLAQFYQTASPEYLKAGIGFAASIALALVPGGASKYLALPVLGLSLGYGLAIATDNQRVTKWVSQRDREVEGLEQRLENLQKLLKQAEQEAGNAHQQAALWAQKAEQSSKDACSLIRTELEALEAQLAERKQVLEAEFLDKLKSRNSEHRRREREWLAYHNLLEASMEMLQSTQSEDLEKVRDQFQAQLEEELEVLQSEFAQKEESYQANWELAKTRYDELIQHYKGITVMYPSQLDVIEAQVSAQMQAIMEERDRLHLHLSRYIEAKRFTGSTNADINGNRLIDFFLGQKIVCDADHCKGCYEFDEIWIRPRSLTLEGFEKYASAISLEFELLEDVKFSREEGCIKAVLKHHNKEKSAAINTIEDRDNWVQEVIRDSNHYRIVAPTGEGKSTLLDNLIEALRMELPALNTTLLDPKYPFTDWNGKTPDFKGCDECLDGVENLDALIEDRFKLATEDVEEQRPIRNFPPEFFAIDEMEELYAFANNPKSGKKEDSQANRLKYLLKRVLRVGRGLKSRDAAEGNKGVIVAFITQSPLCSLVGLNNSDFRNSTNIWLGYDAISVSIENELKTIKSTKLLAYLSRQLELRQQRKDEYIALVSTPKNTFIVSLPPQGYYAKLNATNRTLNYQELSTDGCSPDAQSESTNSILNRTSGDYFALQQPAPYPPKKPRISGRQDQQPCLGCTSSSTKKNGHKQGIQYYICNDCGASFKDPRRPKA